MARFFAEPKHWRIGKQIFKESLIEMAHDGVRGNEGVAMWLGHYESTTAIVTHVGVLRGHRVHKAPARLMIESELINDLTDLAITSGVRLIAQIHSHGTHYGTHLSETDRRCGIAVPGMLSLVAPDYAQRTNTRLDECGVHLFRAGSGWCRFTPGDTRARLSLFDDDAAKILVAGS